MPMSPYHNSQYRAYSVATGTVAKTRQVVILYDNAIKLLQQTLAAITEKNIENRFNLLKKTGEIITGLQSSIDFDQGGDIATILHQFYTGISMRIMAVNFIKDPAEAEQGCTTLIDELKQMRTVWDTIDRNLTSSASSPPNNQRHQLDNTVSASQGNIAISV